MHPLDDASRGPRVRTSHLSVGEVGAATSRGRPVVRQAVGHHRQGKSRPRIRAHRHAAGRRGVHRREPAERPTAGPTRTPATSTAPAPTAADGLTRTPLVVAVHPTRQGLALTGAQLAALRAGTVTDWAELGAPAAPLRTGSLDQVAADRDVLALVPATDVRPPLAAATVDGVHPLRDPAAYPATVPGPAAPSVTTVTVTGDVMLARRVGDRLDQVGDQAAALRPMARRLAASDLTIGNLESTLSKAGAPRQGGDSFGARPQVRAGLQLAGFDVLSLANNHVGDYGPQALRQTLRRVEAGSFAGVGAGTDLAAAARPVVVVRHGVRFGIVAFDAIGETPAATASLAGRPARADAAADRATQRFRPAASHRCRARAARRGRRRARAAALGYAVHDADGPGSAGGGASPGPGRCRPGGRRPSALGPGRRVVVGRAGRLLARQLRLRHGLHARDAGGRGSRVDLLGQRAEGRGAGPGRHRPRLRAAGRSRGAGHGDPRPDLVGQRRPLRGSHAP